jgi:hypothetical protein
MLVNYLLGFHFGFILRLSRKVRRGSTKNTQIRKDKDRRRIQTFQ